MMQIPLQPVPNQTLAVTLARQSAQIALRQNGNNIYFDLLLNNEYIVRTRICRDRQRLLLDAGYQGFVGDFVFIDTQGANNPEYRGLGGVGSRYQLIYLAAGE
jgi:hypothetical protein